MGFLGLLSPQLRAELEHEVTFKTLHAHPLFEIVIIPSRLMAHELTTSALTQQQYATEDMVFNPHTPALHMVLVMKGKILYCNHRAGNKFGTASELGPAGQMRTYSKCVAQDQDWLVEQVLWIVWS